MKLNSFLASLRRRPIILAIITATAGIALSFHIRNQIAQTEAAKARLTAETLKVNTKQELTLFADVLESVCALHALSDAVDQAAMDEFIKKGMVHQHAVLGTFGLTQRIGPLLRSQIESRKKNQPGAYQVVQQGPNNTWIPAENKPVYYPLTWQSQSNGLNIPIGFDFSSLSENARQTIKQLEATHHPVLAVSPNSSSKTAKPAYWVFAPVVSGQIQSNILHPFGNVIGFAVARLNPRDILHRINIPAELSSSLKMTLRPATETDFGSEPYLANGRWHCQQLLEAINTPWVLECSFPHTVTGRHSTAALVFGLIITFLAVSQLLVLARQTQKIEAEVRNRTEELHHANAQLEKTLIERSQLEDELHELTTRERRKVGRDLHDSLGQKLTGAVFLSRSLMNAIDPEKSTSHEHAKTLNETLKSAVTQVRNMARGLSPVMLNDESLQETFKQLAEEMTGLYAIPCRITECAEMPNLNQKTKEQLYLIAREAMNNAARHSKAKLITLRFTATGSDWKLSIEDNGCGLPEAQPAGNGMGTRIMRYRAGLVGAEFKINSTPNRGTQIEITSK